MFNDVDHIHEMLERVKRVIWDDGGDGDGDFR